MPTVTGDSTGTRVAPPMTGEPGIKSERNTIPHIPKKVELEGKTISYFPKKVELEENAIFNFPKKVELGRKNISYSPKRCSDTYHGPSAFSEVENVNVRDFLIARFKLRSYS